MLQIKKMSIGYAMVIFIVNTRTLDIEWSEVVEPPGFIESKIRKITFENKIDRCVKKAEQICGKRSGYLDG